MKSENGQYFSSSSQPEQKRQPARPPLARASVKGSCGLIEGKLSETPYGKDIMLNCQEGEKDKIYDFNTLFPKANFRRGSASDPTPVHINFRLQNLSRGE